ncbi:hypothetical protein NRIC_14830 [Enterococcus florum]|uniref:Type IV secretion system coupling protein TraD DNA-binding domain-containing protein n=1 Tax=Enterococcus florum TaxID=2480627 RepID=A0A4P5PDG9_9ENTE|nr:type IV secretion system DNA-binding domain-containing protein [Enterococcus florum]GCF93592.1 hypothetical protein NRIC_14830 [Enterococcus florum]
MTKRSFHELTFKQVYWQREIDFLKVTELIGAIATQEPRKPIIWEIRSPKDSNHVRYFLGAEKSEFYRLEKLFRGYGSVDFSVPLKANTDKRTPVKLCKKLTVNQPMLSLKISDNTALCRAVLSTLAQVDKEDELVLQIVLGSTLAPRSVSRQIPEPNASWWSILSGNVPVATNEIRNSVKAKTESFQLNTVIRLGVNAKDQTKQQSYILSLFSALKTLEAIGVKLYLQNEETDRLNHAKAPWRYSQKLSVKEMANLFMLPTGDGSFLGVRDVTQKVLLPPRNMTNPTKNVRAFGETLNDDPTQRKLLHLSAQDALKGMMIAGVVGSGKSALIERLCVEDAKNGQGLILIDPKYSLASSLVEKLPEHRLNDVVVMDLGNPNQKYIGINPLQSLQGNRNPELVAESILASFKSLFADTWGVYTEDILQSAILTLAKNKNTTLLHLPILLNNASFRKKMTANLDDKLGLETYWSYFNSLSDGERNKQLAPVMNKLRVLLMRPALKGLLGQPNPKFSLEDVFTKNRILIIPLNSGVVGQTVAELAGSLLINQIFDIAMKRAEIPEHKRKPVVMYIDEVHNFLNRIGSDLESMLSLTRGLGLGTVLAFQNLKQLSPSLKETIFSNCRSKVIFGTPNKKDAAEYSDLTASICEAKHVMSLPQYQVYTTLSRKEIANVWISGKTFAPLPSKRQPADVFIQSTEKYGVELSEIEKSYIDLIEKNDTELDFKDNIEPDLTIGRAKRKPGKKDQ